MSGYSTYTRWQRIEAQAKILGFRLGNPKSGNWSGVGDHDMVALYPDGTALPVFSRDGEIYAGSFNQIETFMNGWTRAHQYDYLLRLSNNEKRKKAEAKEVERQRLAKEREEKRKMFAILANKEEKDVDLT
jgi:hypothetical protein